MKNFNYYECWMVGCRLILLVYISGTVLSADQDQGWFIFSVLIYISLNCMMLILRNNQFTLLLHVLSIVWIVGCAVYIHASFLLLLAISLYEISISLQKRSVYPVLFFLVTMGLVPSSILSSYFVTAALIFLAYSTVRHYKTVVDNQFEKYESIQADMGRLRRSLQESQEFLKQSEYTIKLEERNRLSQRIHDEVGHSMAGALIQMEAAKTMLVSHPVKAAELLDNAIGISKEGLEQIRVTLKDMKPRPEEMGINRLRLFIDEVSAKHAIHTSFVHSGDLEHITPLHFRIIQQNMMEAITNTIKYANADQIHVEIQVLNQLIRAVVSDNGIGASRIVKGLGISGMEERTAALGGTVVVDGTDGFRVITLLPHGQASENSHLRSS
ncbi:sensor histidine kinase [Paenibacillus urinalis]|uniref:sensor histidine kinase n=1 Tax=Paenibacillus urinalis TaxID=521520 RepID=UPI00196122DA